MAVWNFHSTDKNARTSTQFANYSRYFLKLASHLHASVTSRHRMFPYLKLFVPIKKIRAIISESYHESKITFMKKMEWKAAQKMRNQVKLAGLLASFLLRVVIGPLTTSFLMFLSSFLRESVTHLPASLLVKLWLVGKWGSIHHLM